MAITMRKGLLADFDPSKMLAGEWAVTIDPETEHQLVYMCFGSGIVKQMGTVDLFEDWLEKGIRPYLDEVVKECEEVRQECNVIRNQCEGVRAEVIEIKNSFLTTIVPQLEDLVERAEESARIASGVLDVDIQKKGTVGLVDTYEITYNNTHKVEFDVTNGADGTNGEKGDKGDAGAPAGFGSVTASVSNTTGTPRVIVTPSGTNTAKNFDFAFSGLKGEKGDKGDKGEKGDDGTAGNWSDLANKPFDSIDNDTIVSENGVLKATAKGGASSWSDLTDKPFTSIDNDTIIVEDGVLKATAQGGASSWEDLTDKPFDSVDNDTIIVEDGVLKSTASVDVDDAMSTTSENPVQNKVITNRIKGIENSEFFSKNLYKPTLETMEYRGITCTNNGDGTYTLNGTATDTVTLVFGGNTTDIMKQAKSFKFTGCPRGGSENTYKMSIQKRTGSTSVEYKDYGEGTTVVGAPSIDSAHCKIFVMTGTTVNNLLLKPMISLDLNATYDDFTPYVKSNVALDEEIGQVNLYMDRIIANGGQPIQAGSTGVGEWDDWTSYTDWISNPKFIVDENAEEVDLKFMFEVKDQNSKPAYLGGYQWDTEAGKVCIKFGAPLEADTKVAVDITRMRR